MFKAHYSRTEPVPTQACICKSAVKVAFICLACFDRTNKRHAFVAASVFLFHFTLWAFWGGNWFQLQLNYKAPWREGNLYGAKFGSKLSGQWLYNIWKGGGKNINGTSAYICQIATYFSCLQCLWWDSSHLPLRMIRYSIHELHISCTGLALQEHRLLGRITEETKTMA